MSEHIKSDEKCQNNAENDISCNCCSKNKNDEKCNCSFEHEHEHEHCGCHHEHDDDDGCGCGCHHEHDDDDGCGCGCDHSHGEKNGGSNVKNILLYTLGALPIIAAFVPLIPLPVRIIFAAIGYLLFGFPVWRDMIRGFARKKIFTEFTLMCVASVGAFAIFEFADAAAVVYLYSLGEMLSESAYAKSRKNISELIAVTPEYATVIRNGVTERVAPQDVAVGETVLVVTGERVPLDGVVAEGGADADTSSVTGEAAPLALYEGVSCPSGSVILNGTVKIKTESAYENSVVAKLSKAVEAAVSRKARAEKKISKFARVFTPIAFAVAALTVLVGSLITMDFQTWFKAGLVILVVSCPCSLVLSVPLTYFAGLGFAASRGIVFRGGEVMDSMKNVRAVAFDKTGTLTESELRYDGAEMLSDTDEQKFIALAADVLKYSPHAAAVSFCKAVKNEKEENKIENVENIGGRGIVCAANGIPVMFGNAALMREKGIEAEDSRTTVILGAIDGKLVGRLNFSSRIKDNAASAVCELEKLKVDRVALISGDGELSVRDTARAVGIKEYYSSVTPDKKAEIFEGISDDVKKQSHKATVAYCGDGLNDSAVIAMADVGVAMGICGSALTVDSADVILMDDDPKKLCEAVRISRRTSKIATQNIVISLGIKLLVLIIGIIFSAFGGDIPMELAIIADVGAALIAVMNALRASKKGKNEKRS